MKSSLHASLVLVVTVAISTRALADIPPADVEPCRGKTAGAACTYEGTAGTCQDGTCVSPSPPPNGSTYACLRCVTGTATSTQTSPATATPTSTGTSTQTGTDTSTSNSGWCSVGNSSGMDRTAPWLMAAAFSLLFLLARRRQQR
jgi:hypothetical protein